MRLELTRKTDLALRALRTLETTEWTSRNDLAEVVGTTRDFVAHVMSPLTRRGWVESRPGLNGGYRLSVAPEAISILELIEAVEGPVADERCVLRGVGCPPGDLCAIHEPWVRARDALVRELGAISVVAS